MRNKNTFRLVEWYMKKRMNIVGNVNGSYKAPKIDLFEIAEQREVDQQPVKTVSSIFWKRYCNKSEYF